LKNKIIVFLTLSIPYIAVIFGMFIFHNAWLTIILYHSGIIILLFYNKKYVHFKNVIKGFDWKILTFGIIICLLAGPMLVLLWSFISIDRMNLSLWLEKYCLFGVSWIVFQLYFVFIHPLLEEIHFRGLKVNFKRSWMIDFAFAGYHVLVLYKIVKPLWLILMFIVLSITSWIWRKIYLKKKGLIIPILHHISAEVSIILAANFIILKNT